MPRNSACDEANGRPPSVRNGQSTRPAAPPLVRRSSSIIAIARGERSVARAIAAVTSPQRVAIVATTTITALAAAARGSQARRPRLARLRPQTVDACAGTGLDEIVLVEQSRPWAHETHVPP